MYKGKSILVIVPARGGSKGVKNKNIHPLLGRPLIAHTGDVVKQIPWIDCSVVSTDSDQIAEIAEANGLRAPFRRPPELSGDRIGDWDVLSHALHEMEKMENRSFDAIVMLQPTCPLRKCIHVIRTIHELIDQSWDAAWTVSPTDLKYHPLKALIVDEKGQMNFFDTRGSQIIARQQLSPIYHRNGACYAITRSCLSEQKAIKGQCTGAIIIDEPLISIDTLEDFARVEALLAEAMQSA